MTAEIAGKRSCPTCGAWQLSREELRDWIVGQIEQRGYGLSAVADQLNAARVPTPHGGEEWRPSTIQNIYRRATNGVAP